MINFDDIPVMDIEDTVWEEEPSMEKFVDDPHHPGWELKLCECQADNEFQARCKVCGGSGGIQRSKKTRTEYGQAIEQERFLVPVKHHMLTGKEKKYGQNWMKELFLCPRCVDAIPVGFRIRQDRLEAYCRKCDKLGHIEGSHLFWVTEGDFRRIIDG